MLQLSRHYLIFCLLLGCLAVLTSSENAPLSPTAQMCVDYVTYNLTSCYDITNCDECGFSCMWFAYTNSCVQAAFQSMQACPNFYDTCGQVPIRSNISTVVSQTLVHLDSLASFARLQVAFFLDGQPLDAASTLRLAQDNTTVGVLTDFEVPTINATHSPVSFVFNKVESQEQFMSFKVLEVHGNTATVLCSASALLTFRANYSLVFDCDTVTDRITFVVLPPAGQRYVTSSIVSFSVFGVAVLLSLVVLRHSCSWTNTKRVFEWTAHSREYGPASAALLKLLRRLFLLLALAALVAVVVLVMNVTVGSLTIDFFHDPLMVTGIAHFDQWLDVQSTLYTAELAMTLVSFVALLLVAYFVYPRGHRERDNEVLVHGLGVDSTLDQTVSDVFGQQLIGSTMYDVCNDSGAVVCKALVLRFLDDIPLRQVRAQLNLPSRIAIQYVTAAECHSGTLRPGKSRLVQVMLVVLMSVLMTACLVALWLLFFITAMTLQSQPSFVVNWLPHATPTQVQFLLAIPVLLTSFFQAFVSNLISWTAGQVVACSASRQQRVFDRLVMLINIILVIFIPCSGVAVAILMIYWLFADLPAIFMDCMIVPILAADISVGLLPFYVTWTIQQAFLAPGLRLLQRVLSMCVSSCRQRSVPQWTVPMPRTSANVSCLLVVGLLCLPVIPLASIFAAVALLMQVLLVRFQLQYTDSVTVNGYVSFARSVAIGVLLALASLGFAIIFAMMVAAGLLMGLTARLQVILPLALSALVLPLLAWFVIARIRQSQSDENDVTRVTVESPLILEVKRDT